MAEDYTVPVKWLGYCGTCGEPGPEEFIKTPRGLRVVAS